VYTFSVLMLKSNEGRGRWRLQFKTEIMTTPAFWHYNTEQEPTAAEKRLNPSIHNLGAQQCWRENKEEGRLAAACCLAFSRSDRIYNGAEIAKV